MKNCILYTLMFSVIFFCRHDIWMDFCWCPLVWMFYKSPRCFSPMCFGWALDVDVARQRRCGWMLIGSGWTKKNRWRLGWFGWFFCWRAMANHWWKALRKARSWKIWGVFLLICFCWRGLDRNDELNKEFRDKMDKQIHWFGEIMWNIKLWFFHIQLSWDMKTRTTKLNTKQFETVQELCQFCIVLWVLWMSCGILKTLTWQAVTFHRVPNRISMNQLFSRRSTEKNRVYPPWETNIAPKNGWLEYYFPIGEAYFQRLC